MRLEGRGFGMMVEVSKSCDEGTGLRAGRGLASGASRSKGSESSDDAKGRLLQAATGSRASRVAGFGDEGFRFLGSGMKGRLAGSGFVLGLVPGLLQQPAVNTNPHHTN